jgi:hypothetical protein
MLRYNNRQVQAIYRNKEWKIVSIIVPPSRYCQITHILASLLHLLKLIKWLQINNPSINKLWYTTTHHNSCLRLWVWCPLQWSMEVSFRIASLGVISSGRNNHLQKLRIKAVTTITSCLNLFKRKKVCCKSFTEKVYKHLCHLRKSQKSSSKTFLIRVRIQRTNLILMNMELFRLEV